MDQREVIALVGLLAIHRGVRYYPSRDNHNILHTTHYIARVKYIHLYIENNNYIDLTKVNTL